MTERKKGQHWNKKIISFNSFCMIKKAKYLSFQSVPLPNSLYETHFKFKVLCRQRGSLISLCALCSEYKLSEHICIYDQEASLANGLFFGVIILKVNDVFLCVFVCEWVRGLNSCISFLHSPALFEVFCSHDISIIVCGHSQSK